MEAIYIISIGLIIIGGILIMYFSFKEKDKKAKINS